jgi:hypothetical protein
MSIIVECPHCKLQIEIVEVNCAIFRHGVYKETQQQMNPHTPKTECDSAFQENRIYGCGKPFRLVKNNDTFEAIVCDYI